MATPLEITFHGPFVFHFGKKHAWAYAPICDEHYLNILTDMEDVRLPSNQKNEPIRTFNLTGPTKGTTRNVGDNLIITYPWYSGKNGKGGWPNSEDSWQYVLEFPSPNEIYGLVPEYVWLYGYDPHNVANRAKVTADKFARSLRFRYNDSPTRPQFKELTNNQISAKHLGGDNPDPAYSIEIRYGHFASVVKKKAEYYLDAQSCFESMREKLSPCDEWKAFFGDDPNTKRPRTDRFGGQNGPHDCGAPVMALFDEGVSLEPTKPTKKKSTK
jgi:hypothetical protein